MPSNPMHVSESGELGNAKTRRNRRKRLESRAKLHAEIARAAAERAYREGWRAAEPFGKNYVNPYTRKDGENG